MSIVNEPNLRLLAMQSLKAYKKVEISKYTNFNSALTMYTNFFHALTTVV